MYTYGLSASDLNLVAIGVVIWVVAISVAFGFYLQVSPRRAIPARRPGSGPATRGDPEATSVN